MMFSTATVPVNPTDAARLTRQQVWDGLVMKARDARLFLPPGACTRCDVIAEGPNFIMREAVIMSTEITELVSFIPMQKVSFHQVKGPREGVIVNEIIENAAGELQLKFYAYLGLLGVAADSAEERAEQAMMNSEDRGYKAALLSTLARTRALVKEGKL